jgi:hypothetical protein
MKRPVHSLELPGLHIPFYIITEVVLFVVQTLLHIFCFSGGSTVHHHHFALVIMSLSNYINIQLFKYRCLTMLNAVKQR